MKTAQIIKKKEVAIKEEDAIIYKAIIRMREYGYGKMIIRFYAGKAVKICRMEDENLNISKKIFQD